MKRTCIISFLAVIISAIVFTATRPVFASKTTSRNTAEEQKAEVTKQVALIMMNRTINVLTADYINESIKRAEKENAQCLILQLDTPGGMLNSTRDIVQAIFASPVPVVVYVAPSGARAGSAGVFITMASHVAAMAPGTNIGAAHPVSLFGDIKGDMREKVVNDAVAQVRSWAQQRGRNVDWVEKSIRENASITDKEAQKIKVVEIIATDINDLLKQLDGREVELPGNRTVTLHTKDSRVVTFEMTFKEKVVSYISDPNIAYILVLIGILGLFLEYVHPGTLVPGIVGGICLILVFVIQTMPINYIGLALILLAIAFFVAEIFITSFGLFALAGIACFVLGALLLFNTPDSTVRVTWSVIVPTVVMMSAAIFGAGYLALRTQLAQPVSGKEGLIGAIAEARTAINPRGSVFFHGEYWTAHSNKAIPEGARVKVVKVENMQIEVEPVEEGQKNV